MLPMGSKSRRLLNQSTHSSVAYSTASRDRQELCLFAHLFKLARVGEAGFDGAGDQTRFLKR
jgi:hypothetical protein